MAKKIDARALEKTLPWGPRAAHARDPHLPEKHGLYDPAYEHDSCGVGFIAHLKNKASHDIVEKGLSILCNLEHRGAVGADPRAGDGVGILVQVPDKFFRKQSLGFDLPPSGDYAVGHVFLPRDEEGRRYIIETFASVAAREGQELLGWRDVPTDNSTLGYSVLPTEPHHAQVFIKRGAGTGPGDEFERRLYILR